MYRFIYLILIILFALISGMSIKENYQNIDTLSIKENEFKAEYCGNVITMSGSSGCPKITPYLAKELIYRGGNNNI